MWLYFSSLSFELSTPGSERINSVSFFCCILSGGIIGFTLRKDVYNETVRHDIYKETTKFGYREKMDELETTKKWKLLRCDLIDYHTTMDELRAKCFSLMYHVQLCNYRIK